jgi:hypothetical protein
METTYTIEFMRLAEPPLAPIKHPSAFHVAYYCIPAELFLNRATIGNCRARSLLGSFLRSVARQLLARFIANGKKKGSELLSGPSLGLQVMDAS